VTICGVNWNSDGDLNIGLSTLPGGAVGIADMLTSPDGGAGTAGGIQKMQEFQQAVLSSVEVSISISGGVDYGYAGSINDADISDGRGTSLDYGAVCGGGKTEYAGSVTIVEFTPTQLRGNFGATLYAPGDPCLKQVGTVSGSFECGHPIQYDKRSLQPTPESELARTAAQALWFTKTGRAWAGMPPIPGSGDGLPGGNGDGRPGGGGQTGQGGNGVGTQRCDCSCAALAIYPEDHQCSCLTAQASPGTHHPCREACNTCATDAPSSPGGVDEMLRMYEEAAQAGDIPPDVAETFRQSIENLSPEERAAMEQALRQARDYENENNQ
jgi:hypothetical protein